jgi:hypothetical protein
MTQQRKDGIPQPTDWTRHIAALPSHMYSITDVDLIVHRHFPRDVQKFMLVEQKAYNAVVGFAQRDTLTIVHQHLYPKVLRVMTARHQWVNSCYMGLHVLTLSGPTPQQSDCILWDNTRVSFETLVGILRFDYDPNSFKRTS